MDRTQLAALPAGDGIRAYAESLCELSLRQAQALATRSQLAARQRGPEPGCLALRRTLSRHEIAAQLYARIPRPYTAHG